MKYLKQEPGFYRGVIALMLPMILQNFVTNFMALADNFMVGGLSQVALSAVTVANTPFFVLMLVCFGIQSGAAVLVAQYHGKGDLEVINRVFGVGLYISMAVTAFVALVSFFFAEPIMHVLTNNAELWELGASYARVVGFSYFFNSISGMYLSVQRSCENPKIGAIILSGSGLLNIFLNWIFIFGNLGAPKMGVTGAALGTLISRAMEVVAVAVYIRLDKRLPLYPTLIFRPGKVIRRDFMRFALPVVINELLWSTGTSLYTVIIGHMPNNTPLLAAQTIAANLDRLLSVALFACGGAAAVVIGRELGRGRQEQVYSKAVALNYISILVGVVSAGLVFLTRFYLAERFLFPLMRLEPAAVDTALYMLMVIACVLPVRALTLTNLVGIFRGGGDVRFTTVVDAGFLYCLSVPAAAITALVFGLNIRLVYPLMYLDELAKIALCLYRLHSRKWINNVTREVL